MILAVQLNNAKKKALYSSVVTLATIGYGVTWLRREGGWNG